MDGTQGQQSIGSDQMAGKGLRTSVTLAIPGFLLFATGFVLIVAAYAGRTTGNFTMALCGVASFLVGNGLLLSALIILVISLVKRARARREALLSQQYQSRHGG